MVRYSHFRISLLAWLIQIAGIVTLLSVSLKRLPFEAYSWLPINPFRLASVLALILGLSLIYLGSQIKRRKRSAYLASLVILAILTLVEIIHGRALEKAVLYGVLIVYVFSVRRYFVVKNDTISFARSISLATALLLATVFFALATFTSIDQSEYGRKITTIQTFDITEDAVLGEPLPSYVQPSPRDRNLIFSLQASFVVAGVIIFAGLFYPVRIRRKSSSRARNRARLILEEYGTSSEDYLKLWPEDKHYFFYEDSFVAFGQARGVALVIDGASGNPRYFDELRKAFLEECRINSWQPAILHADQTERDAWTALGLKDVYLGSEARVNIERFCEERLRDKHFRYITNKARKDELEVREINPSKYLNELRSVSDEWLSSGRREYAFIMGYFDNEYLKNCRVFAVFRGDEMIAYTNFLPTFNNKDMSIDHMRFRKDVSPATMHFLLMSAIVALKESGVQTLNLGLSPLSKLDENTAKIERRVLGSIRTFGGRYYSFAGLEQFKNKFGPDWEPTYLVYTKLQNLAAVGASINSLTSYQSDYTKSAILSLAAVAAFCYSSFPLAAVLNPRHLWQGLTSVLGQDNQPFAWVFNSMDILSSILIIGICGFFIIKNLSENRIIKYALYFLGLSAIANILAAVFELPAGLVDPSYRDLLDIRVTTHFLVSFVNSFGFFAAVVLWSKAWHDKKGVHHRHILFIIILVCSTIGFIIGEVYKTSGYYIQRVNIVTYGIWLVWFVYDAYNYYEKKRMEGESHEQRNQSQQLATATQTN